MILAFSARPTPIAIASGGLALLVVSAWGAQRDAIPAVEMRVFRAINRLPDGLFWVLWVPMQFGNLVVGAAAGIVVALLLGDGVVAIAVVVAVAAKLVIERLVRKRMATFLEVRQRPGTSEPGAKLRGSDVPKTGPSFPSGHVILAAAVASVLSSALAPAAIAVPWLLVALVMFGRVYVGAHNPLDVTAGLGAGMLIGGLVDLLLR
jgi:undecaprenyl-diphosphatase